LTRSDCMLAHCNTKHHTATHRNTFTISDPVWHGPTTRALVATATHCNTLQRIYNINGLFDTVPLCVRSHCNTLQRTATCCNTLQHTHDIKGLFDTVLPSIGSPLQHTATHCDTLTILRACLTRSHCALVAFVAFMPDTDATAPTKLVTCGMTHSNLWHDSFRCVTWLMCCSELQWFAV